MAAWPASLPQAPLVQGWETSRGDGRLRTPMDAGPAKVRRRFTAAPGAASWPLVLTGAQLSTLLSFWDVTLSGGALAFDLPDPRTAGTVSARFLEAPRWQEVGPDLWSLTLQLELLP